MIIGKAITAGGSGGIKCKLNITTSPGATVTATLGEKVVEAVADESGKAILELSKEGIWTVTATYDGETVSKEVDTSLSVTAELSFITADPVLANNSWEVISAVARAGKAREFWNIGDEKPITIDGRANIAQIMDFDMYDVADPTSYGRTKAGIVFQCKYVEDYSTWRLTSAMERAETFISENPDFKDFVPTVKYPWRDTASAPSLYERKSFFASEFELTGAMTYEKVQVGTQYAFYAAGNSKVKYEGVYNQAKEWFTRSRNTTSGYNVYVGTNGNIASATKSTFASFYVPVFCI